MKIVLIALVSAAVGSVVTLMVAGPKTKSTEILPSPISPTGEVKKKAKEEAKPIDLEVKVDLPPKIKKEAPRRYTSRTGDVLRYDGEGRLISKTTADGKIELITYNEQGEIIEIRSENRAGGN